MLRLQSKTGWWLVTHVDHAHLAGAFAEKWGNEQFLSPEPRERVLRGVHAHDDGWAARDQHPQITRQGKPSAFSVELVGKYSAFEEIDLADYLAVRDRAVRMVAERDPYAALLVSLHTYNLLTARADRTTIQTEQLPLLDAFLAKQLEFQRELRARMAADKQLAPDEIAPSRIENHFRLLQACDNLSLLSCVDYPNPGESAARATPERGRRESNHGRAARRAPLPPHPLPFCRAIAGIPSARASCGRRTLQACRGATKEVCRRRPGALAGHHHALTTRGTN